MLERNDESTHKSSTNMWRVMLTLFRSSSGPTFPTPPHPDSANLISNELFPFLVVFCRRTMELAKAREWHEAKKKKGLERQLQETQEGEAEDRKSAEALQRPRLLTQLPGF